MEKRMSLLKSFAIKAFIIFGLFFGLSFIPDSTNGLPGLYTLASTISYLIIGALFIERAKISVITTLLNATLIISLGLFLVFIISWFNVFTGPYGDACRWPVLYSALILDLCVFFGWCGIFAQEQNGSYNQEEEYNGYNGYPVSPNFSTKP